MFTFIGILVAMFFAYGSIKNLRNIKRFHKLDAVRDELPPLELAQVRGLLGDASGRYYIQGSFYLTLTVIAMLFGATVIACVMAAMALVVVPITRLALVRYKDCNLFKTAGITVKF